VEAEVGTEVVITLPPGSMWTYIYFLVEFEKSPPMAGDEAFRSMFRHLKSK